MQRRDPLAGEAELAGLNFEDRGWSMQRRDPLAGAGDLLDQVTEPVDDLQSGIIPAALARRGKARQRPPRPSEKRRRKRRMGVTFSDADIPDRLRALALQWGMTAPDGKSANVSALVELLLLPQLEAAERGEINPPGGGSWI